MKEWLESFYSDPALRDTLLRSFLPVFSSYVSEATGGPVAAAFVQSLAESYVDRHLGSSRAQLQDVVTGSTDPLKDLAQRFDEWEERRPEKVARNELIRSANAAQVEKMREAGVEKMIWRASGGACPFCQELDGVIISVNGTFFEPGDELNPEGVEHPIHFESTIGHPPVHQGCSCYVEAVSETNLSTEQLEALANDVDASSSNGSQRTIDLALQSGLSQDEAERLAIMAQGWSIDSNSFDGWALREAAYRRGATLGDLPSRPLWKQFLDRYAEDLRPQADQLLDLSTTEVRRQLGTDGTIRVYRGMTVGKPIAGIPTDGSVVEATIEQRPLASWSLSRDEAVKFASSSAEEFGGAAYVLEMDVPVTDVAGLAGTGLGNGAHGEVVVFGRPEHVARVFSP